MTELGARPGPDAPHPPVGAFGDIKKFPLVQPERCRWTEPAGLIVAVGLVLAGATAVFPGYAVYRWPVAAIITVGLVVQVFLGCRINRRREIVAAATNAMTYQLRTAVGIERARWRGLLIGDIVRVVIVYPPGAKLAYGAMLEPQVVSAASKALAGRFTTVKHNQRKGRIMLSAALAQPDPVPTGQQRAQARVTEVAVETFGPAARVKDVEFADDNTAKAFTVHYSAGPKLTVPAVRRRVANAVGERLAGRWKADFTLQEDKVRFARRAPLPTFVPRPVTAVHPGDENFEHIPQAVDEDGEVVYWDISGVMAHQLKAGKTRTGKTVSLIGDAVEATRRGFRVQMIDPKRTEFLGLRGWPNVEIVATRVPEQIAVVHEAWLEMEDRYRRIEEEGASESDFDRMVIIVDEYRQFYANTRAWWTSIKVPGMPAECPVFEELGSLLRMAAGCWQHVILGTQRPDADFLKGEIRDNFSARIATGRLSPDGAKMMFDSEHVGVTIPLNVRGRGTMIGMDDRPREVQYLYTPDPRKATSQADLELLAALRPAEVTWPRLMVEFGDRATIIEAMADSAKKTCLEWEEVLQAKLVPYQAAPIPNADTDEPETGDPDQGQHPDSDASDSSVLIDGYNAPTLLPVTTLAVGDLIENNEGWVCVSDLPTSRAGLVQVAWRDDDDNDGENVVSAEEMIEVRKPSGE